MKIKILGVFVLLIITRLFVGISGISIIDLKDSIASVFFTNSITKSELLNKYQNSLTGLTKVKIMIVPGHDNQSVGAVFRKVKETDINLKLAEQLVDFLEKNSVFDVILVRDKNGYNKKFLSYFDKNQRVIDEFVKNKKITMNDLIRSGEVQTMSGVIHNAVSYKSALRLYGINKWANEIKADIVIHIHFNDYPRRKKNINGKYSGFSIYVPEKQYSNSKASSAFAQDIFNSLQKFYPVSNLKKESKGVVDDQELIAIGAYNTLDSVGVLIEYGYIYEWRFLNKAIRNLVIKDLAFQTYLGINNFFEVSNVLNSKYGTILLPHHWDRFLKNGLKYNKDVLALQGALKVKGFYPPKGFNQHDCPLSGNFGICTKTSVINFQKAYGIMPSSGFVGPLTRTKLNRLFSGSLFD